MISSVTVALLLTLSHAVAEEVTCPPNQKYIKLPTEASRDFGLAMILNMYKNESDHKRSLPPSRASSAKFYKRSGLPDIVGVLPPINTCADVEQSCSAVDSTLVTPAHQRQTLDGMEYGGIYPANHPLWQQVPATLLEEYSFWSNELTLHGINQEFRDNAFNQMRRLTNIAIEVILQEHIRYARRSIAGRTPARPGTPQWQHLTDVARTFVNTFPDFAVILQDLQRGMDRVADNIPAPPVPNPSPGPDLTVPIDRPLTRWLNRNCLWAPLCRPHWLGNALRCVGRCGLDTIDNQYHPNPRADSSRVAAATLWGIFGVILVLAGILVGNISSVKHNKQTPPAPRDDDFLFTNVRIEFPRGGVPNDIKRIDPNTTPTLDLLSIMEDGVQLPPGWDQIYDDGRPGKRYEDGIPESPIEPRDDPEDRSCIPESSNNLTRLIFNLWFTQFRPAVRAGKADSMTFSAYDDEFGGPNEIYGGGQFVVKMWASKMPDWAGVKNDTLDDYSDDNQDLEDKSMWSWHDNMPASGMECFNDTRPYGSFNDPIAARPRPDWHLSVTDACYDSWGPGGVSGVPTKSFTYQGRGKNWDTDKSPDGYGWGFRYTAQNSCQRLLKCQDFTGSHFDAQAHRHNEGGDLDNLYKQCTQKEVNSDGLFRGGRIYHLGPHPTRWAKRDDEACGIVDVWPLLDEYEIQTNPDGSDKVIDAPVRMDNITSS